MILLLGITGVFFLLREKDVNRTQACFGEKCFKVEVAKSSSERKEGLMFRESLAKDEGMLFVFDEEGDYSFHMQNVLISLDIVWMDKKGKVVNVSKNVPPCDKSPCPELTSSKGAMFVLELNADTADRKDIKIGDKITLK